MLFPERQSLCMCEKDGVALTGVVITSPNGLYFEPDTIRNREYIQIQGFSASARRGQISAGKRKYPPKVLGTIPNCTFLYYL